MLRVASSLRQSQRVVLPRLARTLATAAEPSVASDVCIYFTSIEHQQIHRSPLKNPWSTFKRQLANPLFLCLSLLSSLGGDMICWLGRLPDLMDR
ncbi:unnamed protein product [Ambrosiozyma monospora]|uniref:Unnamed protein product n=1 Tax=Ambrosiozyma monospora TaxID=43982 RepID=A0ACB5T328_AMBMO|nr:unnamed protein product [Ambrosiozyma monospora]